MKASNKIQWWDFPNTVMSMRFQVLTATTMKMKLTDVSEVLTASESPLTERVALCMPTLFC
jgi:hypothetical protein